MLKRLRNSLPLLSLAAGTGSVFLANVVARKVFTPAQFVDWAYLTTLTGLFFSFSLLGSEQLIVRSATETRGTLELPRQVTRYIGASFATFLLVYVAVLDGRLFEYRLGAWAVPLLACIGAIQVVYQLERARGQLLASQLALNSWKVALLPMVALGALLASEVGAEFAVTGALLVGLASVGVVYRRARHAVSLATRGTDAAKVFVPFMLSLGMMAVLGVGDRVVLEKAYAADAFADYVYLVAILATPFNVLSTYFGFKEAVRYRRSYSRAGVRADALRAAAVTAALFLAWAALCYATRSISAVPFEAPLWAVLGVVAAIRCGYAVLSAAMGVRGSATAIYAANLLTAIGLLVYAYAAISTGASVVAIVAGYAGVWGVRFVAYFWLIEKGAPAPEGDLGVA